MTTEHSHRRATRTRFGLIATAVCLVLALTAMPAQAAPLPGAIFTTDSTCTGVNVNIFTSKDAVYLDGGPSHPGAAGLPDGEYYVKVTTPDGSTLLGTSVGAADSTPFVVASGEGNCIKLSDVLIRASDASAGYDNTSNPGGVYKVWASTTADFIESSSKTDSFKAPDDGVVPPQEDESQLHVRKFYDANANGVQDGLEGLITGWKVNIQDDLNIDRFTPVDLILQPDDYTVTEYLPVEPNWFLTTANNPTNLTLAANDDTTVTFGNVCVGAGGGLTLGFWSNKNGQALTTAPDLALLTSLNLKNANGSNFDPANNAALKNWLLSGSATNMAYMLSVQLSAMELNVFNGKVSPTTALIYAPGTLSANSNGFATVQAVMDEANTDLGLAGHNNTTSGTPGDVFRADQEELKNALDNANNNQTFAQSTPCAFTFAP